VRAELQRFRGAVPPHRRSHIRVSTDTIRLVLAGTLTITTLYMAYSQPSPTAQKGLLLVCEFCGARMCDTVLGRSCDSCVLADSHRHDADVRAAGRPNHSPPLRRAPDGPNLQCVRHYGAAPWKSWRPGPRLHSQRCACVQLAAAAPGGCVTVGWCLADYEALLALDEDTPTTRLQGASQAQVNRLPTYKFKAPKKAAGAESDDVSGTGDEHSSCMVCLCDFEDGDTLKIVPCFHKFHEECIDRWLLQKAECPVCKASARGNEPIV